MENCHLLPVEKMHPVQNPLLPENFTESVLGSDRGIVFVIDCSNTMQGAPLHSAKAICNKLIERLSEHRCFNLIAFGSGVLEFDAQLHAAGVKAKSLAKEFLDLIDVMGECALGHALRRPSSQLSTLSLKSRGLT